MIEGQNRERILNFLKIGIILVLNFLFIVIALEGSAANNEVNDIAVISQTGSKGEEVTKIQTRLKSWGYFDGPVTGNYGPQTEEAVKKFQKAHGVTADGVANKKTLELIGLSSGSKEDSGSPGNMSEADFTLLARIISAEARGEPYVGQVAVGAVVLNRVESSSFPDTIAGVVYQPGAFTAITDGQINEPISESSKRAAREALNGADPSGGALYYFNPDKTSNKWMRSRPVITRIGEHLFCS